MVRLRFTQGKCLKDVRGAKIHTGEMSERRSRSYVESGSVGSSRGFTWRERRRKELEDRELEQGEGQSGLGEGSYQT